MALMNGRDSERMKRFMACVGPVRGTTFYGLELFKYKTIYRETKAKTPTEEKFYLEGKRINYRNNQETWYHRGVSGIRAGSVLSFLDGWMGREVVRRERVISRDGDVIVTQPIPVKPDNENRTYHFSNGYLKTSIVARCRGCQTASKRMGAVA